MKKHNTAVRKRLFDAQAIHAAIEDMAQRLRSIIGKEEHVAIVGIRTRGIPLAERLRAALFPQNPEAVPLGKLDITLYRDDLSTLGPQPIVGGTDLPFDMDRYTVILADDVIFTGRTARAALEALIEFGRPRAIRLAVLVDRGLREYPIQADVAGFTTPTQAGQIIEVRFAEIDGEDYVDMVNR